MSANLNRWQPEPGSSLEALRQARDTARAEWERLDSEARAIRATLTAAERRARAALRTFERARLNYVEAVEGQEGAA
jgi:hypothetical protein